MAVRTICMAPSNTLSSQDASLFGLHVAELPIFHDYLKETAAASEKGSVPGLTNWWDLGPGGDDDYAELLGRRHSPKVTKDKVLAVRPPRPDFSTHRATYSRLIADVPVVIKAGERSELYEVKPHTKYWEEAGKAEIARIHLSYRSLGIAGIYESGTWYPQEDPPVRKLRLPMSPRALAQFRYLASILKFSDAFEVFEIHLRVERTARGLLQYKICVRFRYQDDWTDDQCWMAANFVVRTFFKCLKVDMPLPAKAVIEAFANALEPLELRPPAPGRVPTLPPNFSPDKIPTIRVRAKTLAPELEPYLPAIADAMYTRFFGQPKQSYLVCCDEMFYEAAIRLPGLASHQRFIEAVKVRGASLLFSGAAAAGVCVSPMVLLSRQFGMVLGRDNPISKALERVIYAALSNPKEAVIIAGVTIAVTALVVATVASGGLAAPATVPTALALETAVEGSVLAGTGAATTTGSATAAGMTTVAGTTGASTATMTTAATTATGAVGNAGAGLVGMSSETLTSTAMSALRASATGVPEALGSGTAPRLGQTLVSWAAQNPQVMAAARPLVSRLLTNALAAPAVKGAISVTAGITVLIHSLTAHAAPATPGAGTEPSQGQIDHVVRSTADALTTAVGRVFLVPMSRQPEISFFEPFTYSDYTSDLLAMGEKAIGQGRARYLGVLTVD